jgi:ankyrin repeat protein
MSSKLFDSLQMSNVESSTLEEINYIDPSSGYTPLIRAAELEKSELVDALLKRGANKNMVNKAGKTALEITTEYLEALQRAPDNSEEDYDTIKNLEQIKSLLLSSGGKKRKTRKSRKNKKKKSKKSKKSKKRRFSS